MKWSSRYTNSIKYKEGYKMEKSAFRQYTTLFRVRFLAGLQYRAAALAGIATQFAWGGLMVLLYRAF